MKKLIILDIDETLIHATENKLEREPDFESELYYVYKRPYVHEFIEFCFAHFSVAVWTTAGDKFADHVVTNLFENDKRLEFVWSRNRCTPIFERELHEHGHLKNLAKVKKKGFPLEHVIMIDDTPSKLRKSYGNLVRVNEFVGDPKDNELLILMKYLKDLKSEENIRKVEKRGWQNKYMA